MKYRIVCDQDDNWMVQEHMPDGSWMTAHHIEQKGRQAFYEAKAWIDEHLSTTKPA